MKQNKTKQNKFGWQNICKDNPPTTRFYAHMYDYFFFDLVTKKQIKLYSCALCIPVSKLQVECLMQCVRQNRRSWFYSHAEVRERQLHYKQKTTTRTNTQKQNNKIYQITHTFLCACASNSCVFLTWRLLRIFCWGSLRSPFLSEEMESFCCRRCCYLCLFNIRLFDKCAFTQYIPLPQTESYRDQSALHCFTLTLCFTPLRTFGYGTQ